VYSYVEELQASSVRHPAHITLKTAVDEHGKFLAHASEVIYDGGAYAAGKPAPTLLPGGNGYATVVPGPARAPRRPRDLYEHHSRSTRARAG